MSAMKSLENAVPQVAEAAPAEAEGPGVNVRGVALTTAAHFTDDIYPGFVPALLPVFIEKFGLSLALAGLLGSVLSLSTSLGQFGFGWLADRVGRRLFLVLGPLSSCVFLSLAPLAGSYKALLLLVAAGGIGVAAFHPSGASLTGSYGGRRKNLAVSLFSAAGTVGFATGPLLIIAVVMNLGLERSYVAMAPGLIMAGVLALATPRPRAMSASSEGASDRMSDHSKLLLLLWFVAVIRAAVIMGFENFIPLIVSERGGSLLSGGTSIFLFLICGSAGGILGGYISDKMDPRRVLLFSSLAPVPLLIAFLRLAPPFNLISLG
jgi:FSR family fosmidomycin resistance protein-like MFS transporter